MNKLICIVPVLFVLACGQSAVPGNRQDDSTLRDTGLSANYSQDSFRPENFLTLSGAEKILGEKAHLTDSAYSKTGNSVRFSSAYTADSKDPSTGKTGVIYFLLEQYASDSSAHNRYSFIYNANKDHGVKELNDAGDEAYFHTDSENFYFIMVRKGKRVFNMKVNKITSKTSQEEFNKVARGLAATL
jgi:hypothetical protein